MVSYYQDLQQRVIALEGGSVKWKITWINSRRTFESFVLIKNADVRVAKNGKKFIAFTFQDTSGTIDGKYWDASEDEITRFTAGNVVLLNGKREVYQNKP